MLERQPVPFEHLPAELLEVVSLLDVDRRRFGQANLRNASGCEFWDRRRDAHVSGQGWAEPYGQRGRDTDTQLRNLAKRLRILA